MKMFLAGRNSHVLFRRCFKVRTVLHDARQNNNYHYNNSKRVAYRRRLLVEDCRRREMSQKAVEGVEAVESEVLAAPAVSFVVPKSFAIGSLAGLCGSLAGMGGGFVMIPLMSSILRLTQHQAHGTSLFAVAATGISGALGYASQEDVVQWDSAVAIALMGMVSAHFGATATTYMSGYSLKKALGVFMLLVAPLVPAKAYLQHYQRQQQQQRKEKEVEVVVRTTDSTSSIVESSSQLQAQQQQLQQRRQHNLIVPSFIGLGSGFLAGMFGVGGGAIVVPALNVATDMTHYQALGTSLCAMTLPAIVGTITHHSKGNVALRHGIAPALALGAFCGGYVGGRIGLKTNEDALRFGFSGLMAFLGIRTLIR